jgi:hypothetical protein
MSTIMAAHCPTCEEVMAVGLVSASQSGFLYMCLDCQTVFTEEGTIIDPRARPTPAQLVTTVEKLLIRLEAAEKTIEDLRKQIAAVDERTEGQIKFGDSVSPYDASIKR